MKLLVFAHRGEAQVFIKKLNLQQLENSTCYGNSEVKLLICGEGIQQTTENLVLCLSQNPGIKEILNFGISGSLKDFDKYSIHSIRTAYAYQLEPIFHSFSSADTNAKIDCLSYYKRVTQSLSKNDLSHLASLVDREIWAIGSVAKKFKLPWYSYKIVSDITEEETDCKDIFHNALEFSQKLYNHFIDLSFTSQENEPSIISELEKQGYWITFTETKRIEKLISLTGLSLDDFQEISNSEITSKQKTQRLLTKLEAAFDPITYQAKQKIKKQLLDNNKKNITFSVDNNLENIAIKLQSKIEDENDLQKLIESLHKFPLKEIQATINGDLS